MTATMILSTPYSGPIRERQNRDPKKNGPRVENLSSKRMEPFCIENAPKKSNLVRSNGGDCSMASYLSGSSSCLSNSSSSFSSTRSSSSSRSNVSFKKWVAVKDTLSRHDMTEEEKESFWFHDDEFARIKLNNKKLVKHIQARKSVVITEGNSRVEDNDYDDKIETDGNSHFCLRGLETGFRQEAHRRRNLRQTAVYKILTEQKLQTKQRYKDDQVIADIYLDISMKCKFNAIHKALEDRMDVESYCKGS